MTAVTAHQAHSPSTAELLECLGTAVQRRLGTAPVSLTRRPYLYATSFALEACEMTLAGGEVVPLIFKNLSSAALMATARRTRPGFVYRPEREIEVYRRLLAGSGLGTAGLLAAEVDPGRDRFWLFLERVAGVELYQVADRRVWQQAARWLKGMHRRLDPAAAPESLTRLDAAWYRTWMQRAVRFAGAGTRRELRRLAAVHPKVVDRLCALPPAVIHGDLYASNVLTAPAAAGRRICPVDWERASVGPGLLDLASLVTGWDRPSAESIARAYAGPDPADLPSLAFCRLQLCIQWLGWSPEWHPPAEHRRDWLGEALQLAGELDL